MNVFLHIGTEKTGSSFLQKTCAVGRDHLAENGIFFPDAGRDEKRLLEGNISPGNASKLREILASGSREQLRAWLARRFKDAKAAGCCTTLLSNENLIVSLAKEGSVDRLVSIAGEAGAETISMLLMVREPVDQALSLYKHRAKSGRAPGVANWISADYDLPNQIGRFLKQADSLPIDLHVRKYSSDADRLLKVFFNDWLNVIPPDDFPSRPVNQSLTLTEVELMSVVRRCKPEAVPVVYSSLMALDNEAKAQGVELERRARKVIENYLNRYHDAWVEIAARLAHDGGISIPREDHAESEESATYELSHSQLGSFVQSVSDASTVRFQLMCKFRSGASKLGSAVRALLQAAPRVFERSRR